MILLLVIIGLMIMILLITILWSNLTREEFACVLLFLLLFLLFLVGLDMAGIG